MEFYNINVKRVNVFCVYILTVRELHTYRNPQDGNSKDEFRLNCSCFFGRVRTGIVDTS
jgi:hypothetical protein